MTNNCSHYKQNNIVKFTDKNYHQCETCMWIDPKDKTQCHPPDYDCCGTEDDFYELNETLTDLYWIKGRLETALKENRCIRNEFETVSERLNKIIKFCEFIKYLNKEKP
ncbi:MAG: hypothetical protein WCX79_00450 [Candidatus Paceibacterota bacterium]|jgi:hypothetical protein